MKFKLTFLEYEQAWHENFQAERLKRGLANSTKDLYTGGQYDYIPYIEWEKCSGGMLLLTKIL